MAIRSAYLMAARSVVELVEHPAVATAWTRPSALAGLTVGGLASHLTAQVRFVPRTVRDSPQNGEPVGLLGHYQRVTWIGADLDAEINVTIRANSETEAAAGDAASVAATTRAAVEELTRSLPAVPADWLVRPPAGPWSLALDDFLVTRMMEIAVHSDDLACSVGIPTPDLPDQVLEPVFALLSALAIRRHGATAVLRALSRAERAPATITAF